MPTVKLYWKPGCTGCEQARAFLADKHIEAELRHLIKQPLTVDELRTLAERSGGLRELVAPKRRKQADEVSDAELAAWLAADGGRVRRPIVVVADKALTLGFTAAVREQLEAALAGA